MTGISNRKLFVGCTIESNAHTLFLAVFNVKCETNMFVLMRSLMWQQIWQTEVIQSLGLSGWCSAFVYGDCVEECGNIFYQVSQ